MGHKILLIILGFGISMPLRAQIWEELAVAKQNIVRSESSNTHHTLNQFRLIDFPENPLDGDFINIPGPAGQLIAVEIRNSPVLEEALQIRFPQIRSFSFRSNQITGRLASDPGGIDI